ncbi:hypothetical protein [Actinocorallia aurantiaca]|uniref:Uncharacterized protein n=1 Tax=Actinocorallia aurantiaca TaxID=46204 RepID=A0ABN3UB97_9ACTN
MLVEGATVLVELEEMVVRTSWDSPSWREKTGEQRDRIARASVRGL